MKDNILFILIFILYSKQMIAQEQGYRLSITPFLTSRYLMLGEYKYTKEESKLIHDWEVPKPSFAIDLGFAKKLNKKISLAYGVGWRHTRYGTKIFEIPAYVTTNNSTPPKVKQVIKFNQFYVFGNFYLGNSKPILFADKYLFRLAFYKNELNYAIKANQYDKNNNLAWGIEKLSDEQKVHPYDVSLGFGLNYKFRIFKNREIGIAPLLNIFLHPYEAHGKPQFEYIYLYFDKNSKGILWDFGINCYYRFRKLPPKTIK